MFLNKPVIQTSVFWLPTKTPTFFPETLDGLIPASFFFHLRNEKEKPQKSPRQLPIMICVQGLLVSPLLATFQRIPYRNDLSWKQIPSSMKFPLCESHYEEILSIVPWKITQNNKVTAGTGVMEDSPLRSNFHNNSGVLASGRRQPIPITAISSIVEKSRSWIFFFM